MSSQLLLLASSNTGKLAEITQLLNNSKYKVISPIDLDNYSGQEVEETGSTFAANALLKAKFFGQLSRLPTVADDSGLLIHALNDFPGVNSNRWFKGSDSKRCQAILKKMANCKDRSAAFLTVICYFEPQKETINYFEGKIEGEIAQVAAGSDGFGYDPIFIPKGYNQTFAQLGQKLKNQISHRAQALEKLVQFFKINGHY